MARGPTPGGGEGGAPPAGATSPLLVRAPEGSFLQTPVKGRSRSRCSLSGTGRKHSSHSAVMRGGSQWPRRACSRSHSSAVWAKVQAAPGSRASSPWCCSQQPLALQHPSFPRLRPTHEGISPGAWSLSRWGVTCFLSSVPTAGGHCEDKLGKGRRR